MDKYLYFTIGIIFSQQCFAQTVKDEYCQWENFEASCAVGHVIVLGSAFYGRREKGRCVEREFGYVGCGKDVTREVDSRCSGRQNCSFSVTTFHGNHGCPKDLTAYLIADYVCQRVTDCELNTCESQDSLLIPISSSGNGESSGYLASSTAMTRGCGTARCPWLLEVPAGQHINVTLLDFGTAGGTTDTCHWYCVIYDGSVRKDVTQCELHRTREALIYTSVTNQLRIEFFSFPVKAEAPNFLLKYQATGCADLAALRFAEVSRRGQQISVNCLYSSEAWHLTCSVDKWVGQTGNCPASDGRLPETGYSVGENASPIGMLLVIGLGVALGVAVGVALLCLVVVYMRRRRSSQTHKPSVLLQSDQYRSYLAKSLGGQGQIYGHTGALYSHDYSSTLHPAPNRSLADNLPPPPPPNLSTHPHNQMITAAQQNYAAQKANTNPDPFHTNRTSAHGSTDSLSSTVRFGANGRFKEHIYEMPKFADTIRAQSVDAAISYSPMKLDNQPSNRTN